MNIVSVPILNAEPMPHREMAKFWILQLDRHAVVIFVSENAVQFGMPLLSNPWVQWPVALQCVNIFIFKSILLWYSYRCCLSYKSQQRQ